MRLLQHHSKGYWAAMISIASFLVIHGIFYFAHESINAAAPHQSILYKLDRGLEPIENLVGYFHSDDEKLRDSLTHVIERVEEVETIAAEDEKAWNKSTFINNLLFEISHDLEGITQQIMAMTQDSAAKEHQALLLHAQSILEHIENRLLATQITSDTVAVSWDATLTLIEELNTQVLAVIETAGIELATAGEDEQATIVVPTASILPTEEILAPAQAENSCGEKLSNCTATSDCCVDAGLTCQPTINSNGERTKRCMPEIDTVCEVRCQNYVWSQAQNCQNTVVLPNYESCSDIEQTACAPLANNARNTRRCVQ